MPLPLLSQSFEKIFELSFQLCHRCFSCLFFHFYCIFYVCFNCYFLNSLKSVFALYLSSIQTQHFLLYYDRCLFTFNNAIVYGRHVSFFYLDFVIFSSLLSEKFHLASVLRILVC